MDNLLLVAVIKTDMIERYNYASRGLLEPFTQTSQIEVHQRRRLCQLARGSWERLGRTQSYKKISRIEI